MKTYSASKKARVIEAYKSRGPAGLSAAQVAKQQKVPLTTIRQWVGKAEVQPEPKLKPARRTLSRTRPGSKASVVASGPAFSDEARRIIGDLLFENYMLKRKLNQR